ncbi:hypothetical protein D3C77_451920 [compost metagenome]
MRRRFLDHLQRKPGIIRTVFHIVSAALQPFAAQQRLLPHRLRSIQHSAALPLLHASQEIIHFEPERCTEPAESTLFINRQQHPFRRRHMRAVLIHNRPLLAYLRNDADIKLLQITQPAMNKLRRTAGRARREEIAHDSCLQTGLSQSIPPLSKKGTAITSNRKRTAIL